MWCSAPENTTQSVLDVTEPTIPSSYIQDFGKVSLTTRLFVPNYICRITKRENYRRNIFQVQSHRNVCWAIPIIMPLCRRELLYYAFLVSISSIYFWYSGFRQRDNWNISRGIFPWLQQSIIQTSRKGKSYCFFRQSHQGTKFMECILPQRAQRSRRENILSLSLRPQRTLR